MRRSAWWAWVGLPILGVLIAFALAPLILLGDMRRPLERMPGDVGVERYEEVEMKPLDEPLTLRGWYYPVAAAKAVVILVHGGGDNRASRYSSMIELARDLGRRGYAALAIDLRNHGQSDASRLAVPTFGPTEANDVIGAIEFLAQRAPGLPVAALGFSMGGNAVLYAAAKDSRLRAIVTVATYADFSEVIANAAAASTGVPALVLRPVIWSAEAFYGLPVSWARAEDIAPRLLPGSLLVIHNEADPIVPVEHARRLAEAAPEAQLWVTPAPPDDHPVLAASGPWGTHVRSFELHPEEFLDRVTAHIAARTGG